MLIKVMSEFSVRKNRKGLFPSCLLPPCQKEYQCETIDMINLFRLQVRFHANQTYFLKKDFVLGLVLN